MRLQVNTAGDDEKIGHERSPIGAVLSDDAVLVFRDIR